MHSAKNCFKCGKEKDLSEFYAHKMMKDGRLNKCKECTKVDVQSNYRKNIDHYKEYERGRAMANHRVQLRAAYAKTDSGKDANARAGIRWRQSNRIKRGANIIVGNAVRGGVISKPDKCEACGSSPSRLNGHHDDYAFPLVVRWLCPGCHAKWHRENGPGRNG